MLLEFSVDIELDKNEEAYRKSLKNMLCTHKNYISFEQYEILNFIYDKEFKVFKEGKYQYIGQITYDELEKILEVQLNLGGNNEKSFYI